jgi:hypothetical protein
VCKLGRKNSKLGIEKRRMMHIPNYNDASWTSETNLLERKGDIDI